MSRSSAQPASAAADVVAAAAQRRERTQDRTPRGSASRARSSSIPAAPPSMAGVLHVEPPPESRPPAAGALERSIRFCPVGSSADAELEAEGWDRSTRCWV